MTIKELKEKLKSEEISLDSFFEVFNLYRASFLLEKRNTILNSDYKVDSSIIFKLLILYRFGFHISGELKFSLPNDFYTKYDSDLDNIIDFSLKNPNRGRLKINRTTLTSNSILSNKRQQTEKLFSELSQKNETLKKRMLKQQKERNKLLAKEKVIYNLKAKIKNLKILVKDRGNDNRSSQAQKELNRQLPRSNRNRCHRRFPEVPMDKPQT